MRRPRVRFTVRRTMLLVMAVGVALRLLTASREASSDAVYHVRQYRDTGTYTVRGHPLLEADEIHEMGYWSRYWRRVLGLSLTDNPCRCKAYFEMVESRSTIDVRTTHDGALGNAYCDWLRFDSRHLPEPAQALHHPPARNWAAAKKQVGPAAPSPRPF